MGGRITEAWRRERGEEGGEEMDRVGDSWAGEKRGSGGVEGRVSNLKSRVAAHAVVAALLLHLLLLHLLLLHHLLLHLHLLRVVGGPVVGA